MLPPAFQRLAALAAIALAPAAVLAQSADAVVGSGRTAGAGGDSGWLLFFEAGAELFDKDGFAIFEPGLEYRGEKLAVALGGPLRIGEATTDGVSHMALRRADVDEHSDLGGMLRLVSWGAEGDPVRVLVGSEPSFTLGSGGVVDQLRPGLDPDHPRAGAFASFDLGPLALEGLASDVLSSRVFAGRVTVPLGERWRFGGTGAVEPEPVPDAAPVSVLAVDASVVALRGEWLALAPYVEAAGLASRGGGAGLHAGLAADLRLGPGGDTLIGLRGEWRAMERGYLPRYFDEFHEVERWAYPRAGSPPKHLAAREAPGGQGFAGEARLDLPSGLGVHASIEGRRAGPWAAAVGADVRSLPGVALGFLVARRGAAGAGDLVELGAGTWLVAESRVDLAGPFHAFATVARGYRVPLYESAPVEFTAGSLGIGAAVAP